MATSTRFQKGDLITLKRSSRLGISYNHWAVYVGNENGEDYVVHVYKDRKSATGDDQASDDSEYPEDTLSYADPVQYKKDLDKDLEASDLSATGEAVEAIPFPTRDGGMKRDRLRDITHGSDPQINNKLDDLYSPRTREEIVRVANKWAGRRFKYNLLYFNCEHFAHLCRNGKVFSDQVDILKYIHEGKPSKEKLKKVVGEEGFKLIMEDVIQPYK